MASDLHESASANAPVPLTRDGWSFAARIFAAQMLLVIVVIAWLGVASYQHVARVALDVRQSTVATVSTTLANDPFVANALQEADPSAALQPYTQNILSHAQTIDFITIMTPDLLRVTHPNPAQLGKPYSGSTAQALRGEVFSEQAVGTLGRSVRTIAPVYAKDGTLVGMVATGITLESLQVLYREELPQILLVSLFALLLAGFTSWSFSKYIQSATLGFGPHGLRRLYAFYFSALHSVREGLILLDRRHRIVLYNSEAARLLKLPAQAPGDGLDLSDAKLPDTLRELMSSGRAARDEIHLGHDSVLAVSQSNARLTGTQLPGRYRLPLRWLRVQPPSGQVLTLRDLTEVQELTGEVQSLKTFSTALRAQTHEHANRLHTIATLIENGSADKALAFAVDDRQNSQALTDAIVQNIDDVYLSSLLVAKSAQAHERGVNLSITATGVVRPDTFQATDIVT
ncbi:MAG TPA: histidine kinase, partial [Micrococcaceae bacterium]|nr:histidine kinase [Micrococcaceae bacterium]